MRKLIIMVVSSLAVLLLAIIGVGVAIQTSTGDVHVCYFHSSSGDISRALVIEEVAGFMENGTLQRVDITLRIAPGSEPYNFSLTNITIEQQVYWYPSDYDVAYKRKGAGHNAGMLIRGDTAIMNVRLGQPLTSNSPLSFVIDTEKSTKAHMWLEFSSTNPDGNITLYART